MTLTNRLIKLFLFSSTVLGSSFSVVKSYETLKNRSEPTHATPHINNLIRNGLGQLNKDERVSCIEEMYEIFKYTKSNNLKLNAGHDLNLENLPDLIDLNIIDEVSIGHAIITESLIHGLDNVLSQYIKIIK